MFGVREAGVLGASVALAAGVAYLIWNYASSSGEKKLGAPPSKHGTSVREDGEKRREAAAEESVVVAAAPVVAAAAQKASEVKH